MTRAKRDRVAFERDHVRVVLTGAWFECTRCGALRRGSEMGLRQVKDGTVRNQPQCNHCRSGRGRKRGKRPAQLTLLTGER
jgi:hypothetical protein